MEKEAAEKSNGDFEIYVFNSREQKIKLLEDHLKGQNLGPRFHLLLIWKLKTKGDLQR